MSTELELFAWRNTQLGPQAQGTQSWAGEVSLNTLFSKEIIGDVHLSDYHSVVSLLKCH